MKSSIFTTFILSHTQPYFYSLNRASYAEVNPVTHRTKRCRVAIGNSGDNIKYKYINDQLD